MQPLCPFWGCTYSTVDGKAALADCSVPSPREHWAEPNALVAAQGQCCHSPAHSKGLDYKQVCEVGFSKVEPDMRIFTQPFLKEVPQEIELKCWGNRTEDENHAGVQRPIKGGSQPEHQENFEV